MTIKYIPAIKKGDLHKIEIDGEKLETTRQKEVLKFAESRIYSKFIWKELKRAVDRGEPMEGTGGGILS